jgi:spore coat polysaccharide biosynthesis predicted glycosyltransferase SpsG
MESLAEALTSRGIATELVSSGPALEGDLVVVDSYSARADGGDIAARVIAAVDDLNRDLHVDVVIDPAPGADPRSHAHATTVLAGASYALLAGGHVTRHPTYPAQRVLVTTGAADAAGTGKDIATSVLRLGTDLDVRLVTGPWGCRDVPPGVSAVDAPNGLDEQLAWADLVITAGGVTMLEAMRAGRPVVAIVTAENQRRAVTGAAAAGAVLVSPVDGVAAAVGALVRDAAIAAEIGRRGAALVDGRGPRRVAEVLARVVT